jgi:hypothetical protein
MLGLPDMLHCLPILCVGAVLHEVGGTTYDQKSRGAAKGSKRMALLDALVPTTALESSLGVHPLPALHPSKA